MDAFAGAARVNFPDDAVLVARGKYATLGASKRDHMKKLHGVMSRLTDQARVVLRYDEDAEVAYAVFMAMQGNMDEAASTIGQLAELTKEMDELKPSAWGKETK